MAYKYNSSIEQKKLPITRSVSLLMAVLLLLSGLLLSALVYQQHQIFLAHQQEMSHRALQNSSEQIDLYLQRERQLAALFAEAWQDDLHRWAKVSGNQAKKAPFWPDLQRIMPGVKNFTLADRQGQLSLSDPEGVVGASCQRDIRYYARYQMPNEIFVHHNQQGDHVDVVTRLPPLADSITRYFFVSLNLSALTDILRRSQPLHHQLLLQRRDNGTLELNAEGLTDTVNSNFSTFSSMPLAVAGTRWQLLDRVDDDFIAQNIWRGAWLVLSSLLLLIVPVLGLLWLVAREERRRLGVEQSLADSHRRLEQRVRARTAELSFMTAHDPLTQLLNRRELEWRLEQTLREVYAKKSECVLCVVGVDRFKVVNETAGHSAGDQLLKFLAQHLSQEQHDGDTLARLGGDEFALIFQNCSASLAVKQAAQLCQGIRELPFAYQGHIFDISVSAGLVLINAYSNDKTSLLSQADRACYIAKQQGRNQVYFFDPAEDKHRGRSTLMRRSQDLATALTTGNLELYCQPLLSLQEGGGPPRYEALIRMHAEDGSLILPDEFIPAAERFGRMSELDFWVTENALQAMQEGKIPFCLGVNLSAQTLANPVNVTLFGDLLKRYGGVLNASVLRSQKVRR
ncbi:MAG: diguanylate cyclase [Gammaproteobacteria bacterium]|nr:diguanylate cyclase [Gammaproteobacteria bacterium]